MSQDIVGNRDQSVFLAKHFAILANNGKTVNIRVNNKAHIGFCLANVF